MKRAISILLCITLVFSLLFTLNGCDTTENAKGTQDLMTSIKPNDVSLSDDSLIQKNSPSYNAYYNFAIEIFKRNQNNSKNMLISPLSILCALAMSSNGAQGDTLKEFETLFGLSAKNMNTFLKCFNDYCVKQNNSLKLANSIWLTNDNAFTVNQKFLQTTSDYYNPQVYSADFNERTVKDINNWVKKNTDGMIPNIIEELDSNTVMCLINALAFEAEWEKVYDEYQVRDGYFYAFNGNSENAEYMYSDESTYLSGDDATGFVKYYDGRKYAFVAILPNKDVKLSDYVSSLTGDKISQYLSNAQNITVKTKMPKFEYSFDTELSETLKSMGLALAFDSRKADFNGIGAYDGGNIYLDKIIHKTYISVAEKGTRAGAVTAELLNGSAAPGEPDPQVYLDRPFVYMIIDCEYNLPFFMGTVISLE